MTIRLRKLALTLFLTLTLLLHFGLSYGKEQLLPKTTKLKSVVGPYISFAPWQIAEEESFFNKQGLQIEFVKIIDSVEALPTLIKGDLDVMADVFYPSYLNAIARGANIKIVADRGYLSPTGCTYSAIMARRTLVEEGKLNHISQLKGRRVAVTQVASIMGYFLEKILSQEGLTLADVEHVVLPLPARIAAFEKGAIDIAFISEPWISRILDTGHAVIWKPAQHLIPNVQFAFLMYGSTLLEKNPDAGKRFMVAYLKGVRQYNQGKTKRNLEIIAKHTGLDREFLQKCCWQAIRNDGRINIDSMLDYQSWALKKGFLDKLVPPSQFWDPSFIEYAIKISGTAKN
jgi:NitT/TauT family transport system substrate-binding protein